jgi:ribonuclease P protein component
MIAAANRLRRHADYQRVYSSSRKRFSKQMSYFFLLRNTQSTSENSGLDQLFAGPRVGLTVGRAMGKAVQRNRIKRRMREAVRLHIAELHAPVDLVLHPNRRVAEIEFSLVERDVAQVFKAVQQTVERQLRETESSLGGRTA